MFNSRIFRTNYGGDPYRGLSAAYDHRGASALPLGAGVGGSGEEVIMATFDIAALRAARGSPTGVTRLRQPAVPALCWPRRRDEYRRPSMFGRFA